MSEIVATGRTRVALLGSTGSIGRQALDVLESLPDDFEVVALAAARDARTLSGQIARHRPALVSLADEALAAGLEMPPGSRLVGGAAALEEICADERVDLVLVGTGGIVSLTPVLAALQQGKVVATANKETLVAGGHLVMPLARSLAGQRGRDATAALHWLRPIDSEHSAIWQCLVGESQEALARLILTASGGPFRQWSSEQLQRATPQDALAHPTWSMGAKITVDSATLMNKGLEVIEAHWLYDVGYEQIDVVIHPQSIIHSLVEFADGSLKAQLGHPDMRIPIQYALTFPKRRTSPAPRLAASELPQLSFEDVDGSRFPALELCREAGRRGPWASAALIAADEVAVSRFLAGSLSFPGISDLCAQAVERFGTETSAPTLDELIALDAEVRPWAATVRPVGASQAP